MHASNVHIVIPLPYESATLSLYIMYICVNPQFAIQTASSEGIPELKPKRILPLQLPDVCAIHKVMKTP